MRQNGGMSDGLCHETVMKITNSAAKTRMLVFGLLRGGQISANIQPKKFRISKDHSWQTKLN